VLHAALSTSLPSSGEDAPVTVVGVPLEADDASTSPASNDLADEQLEVR
jgi:hypothetical protein